MKLALTATAPKFDAPFERRFGRCAYFIVVDTETREWQALPNPATEARGGAGTQAAQFIANQGVTAVVSGRFGPNAYAALNAAGLQMYTAGQGSVDALFEEYLAGKLKSAGDAASSA